MDMIKKKATIQQMKVHYPKLEAYPIRGLNSSDTSTYLELPYFKAARGIHGGDVGVAAARLTAETQHNMTIRRLQQYASRNLRF